MNKRYLIIFLSALICFGVISFSLAKSAELNSNYSSCEGDPALKDQHRTFESNSEIIAIGPTSWNVAGPCLYLNNRPKTDQNPCAVISIYVNSGTSAGKDKIDNGSHNNLSVYSYVGCNCGMVTIVNGDCWDNSECNQVGSEGLSLLNSMPTDVKSL